MKRFALLIMTLFVCISAIAETITINWGVDNQLYTTTTCEIGGDVILPPVSKRGYVFRGWKAEHFDRGTFVNWVNVPTSVLLYSADYNDNRTPKKGDYITINDVSGYGDNFPIDVTITTYGSGGWDTFFTFTMSGETKDIRQNGQSYTFSNGVIVTRINSSWGGANISINRKFKVGNSVIEKDTSYDLKGSITSMKISSENPPVYEGTWRFIYVGDWDTTGKEGWKPDYQITDE